MSPVEAAIPDLPAAVAYLFAAYRVALDDTTGLVYEHQLADLPFPLVRAAVIEAPKRLPKPFVPGIQELRALCDTIRGERAALTPFVPCAACRETRPGWDLVVDPNGTRRLTRCECWRRHQQLLTTWPGDAQRPALAEPRRLVAHEPKARRRS
jgi:hypothetical protein